MTPNKKVEWKNGKEYILSVRDELLITKEKLIKKEKEVLETVKALFPDEDEIISRLTLNLKLIRSLAKSEEEFYEGLEK